MKFNVKQKEKQVVSCGSGFNTAKALQIEPAPLLLAKAS